MTRPRQPRDDQGWRVPSEGTLSARIYGLYKAGYNARQIAIQLDCDLMSCRVLICRFKRPDYYNNKSG